jgi:serine protease
MPHLLRPICAAVFGGCVFVASANAADAVAVPAPRLVVTMKEGAREAPLALERDAELAGARLLRSTGAGARVLQLAEGTTREQALQAARRLQARSAGVERAELDHWLQPHDVNVPAPADDTPVAAAVGVDRFAHHQWPLMARTAVRVGRANFQLAWLTAVGQPELVVAVLDSGTTYHPDALGRELEGYDTVTDLAFAADGGTRDADPTDVGDWCSSGRVSSWHGTAVGALIGAIAGNGYGVAGAAHGVRLQHLRVLGRCGAWSSDVADAIVWAAGGSVAGLPRNATPARVINLSLGAPTERCSTFMQQAVDQARRLGAVVVASAGNAARPGVDMPANCDGAIAVAAGTESGDLAHYSNHSPRMTLTGPAGGLCKRQPDGRCVPFGTATSGTLGRTLFEQHAEVRYFGGTSAAAPHVSAAAALMLSANPELTPAQVASALRASAFSAYPSDSFCREGAYCGAGFLDAQAAVLAALQPVLTVSTDVRGAALPAQRVALRAALMQHGVPLEPLSIRWTQTAGPRVAVSGADATSAAFRVPSQPGKRDFAFVAEATLVDGRIVRDSVIVPVNVAPRVARTAIAVAAGPLDEPLGMPDDASLQVILVDGPDGLRIVDGRLVWEQPSEGTWRIVLRTSDGEFESDDQIVELRVAGDTPDGGGGALGAGWLALLAVAVAALRRRA